VLFVSSNQLLNLNDYPDFKAFNTKTATLTLTPKQSKAPLWHYW